MNHSKIRIQKPFLKWVGGKTQIIQNVINKIPEKINNYHEPCVGGGSVLFAILSLKEQKKINIEGNIYAYDINESLINVYKSIQNHKDELLDLIESYMEEYDVLNGTTINRKPQTIEEAKTSKESYYYWMRQLYNSLPKSDIKRCALFICLNKTCFRGMYREGPNGFNVPYGHYKKTPKMMTKYEINIISKMIQDVIFICCDFQYVFQSLEKNDMIYIDPPYAPENEKSFVQYVADGFNLQDHLRLFTMIKNLDKSVKFVMSNSNVELVKNAFQSYGCETIPVRRAINSKHPDSIAKEVIIYN